jgi:hypothetical protein
VIVRISTEGQYEVAEGDIPGLNELDNKAVSACEAGDEASFQAVYASLLDYVREKGNQLADDSLSASDLILPPPDVTLEEARAEFSGEGLIPG